METHDRDDELSGSRSDQASPANPSKSKPEKRRGRRIAVGLLLASAIIAIVQHWAPSTDHQIANLITIAIVITVSIQFTWNLHWLAVSKGKRWHVPLAVVVLSILAPVLFDFEGFSGEIVPQIRFAFGSRGPKLQETLASQEVAEVLDSQEAESTEITESTSTESERRYALSDFPQFLGPQRNGVLSRREFSVPETVSEIETLWNIGIGEGWASFAVVKDRAITLEQRDDQECLTCYRLSDGALLWKIEHASHHDNTFGGPGPRSTPTIHEDRVFAQGQDGTIWCVDWLSGKIVWQVELLQLAGWNKESSESAISWARSGSPLIVDDLCVVPFGGPQAEASSGRSLIALSLENGETVWTAGDDQISYASPMLLNLAGQRQIVSVNEQTISGHAVETGEQLWSFEWIGQSNGGANCASVIPAGTNQFVIGKGYGGGSALVEVTANNDGELTAEAIWTSSRVLKTKFTHACVDGSIAYAINNGSLEAVNLPEGLSNWQQSRRERLGQGQLLLVDDILVGQAEAGGVVFAAADPNEYRELLRLPALEAKTWNIPTIAGRHLLVRNDRQAFCFLLPARKD